MLLIGLALLLLLWVVFIGKLTLDSFIIGVLASIVLVVLNSKLKLFTSKHR